MNTSVLGGVFCLVGLIVFLSGFSDLERWDTKTAAWVVRILCFILGPLAIVGGLDIIFKWF
jgi:hypothetical protein